MLKIETTDSVTHLDAGQFSLTFWGKDILYVNNGERSIYIHAAAFSSPDLKPFRIFAPQHDVEIIEQ